MRGRWWWAATSRGSGACRAARWLRDVVDLTVRYAILFCLKSKVCVRFRKHGLQLLLSADLLLLSCDFVF